GRTREPFRAGICGSRDRLSGELPRGGAPALDWRGAAAGAEVKPTHIAHFVPETFAVLFRVFKHLPNPHRDLWRLVLPARMPTFLHALGPGSDQSGKNISHLPACRKAKTAHPLPGRLPTAPAPRPRRWPRPTENCSRRASRSRR